MQNNDDGILKNVFKGAVFTVLFTLTAVLVFAVFVKIFSFNSAVIKAVNQFIKSLAVFTGCFFSVRGNRGLIKGVLIGLISAVFTGVLFLIVSKGAIDLSFWLDLLFGMTVGGISGAVSVNLRGN